MQIGPLNTGKLPGLPKPQGLVAQAKHALHDVKEAVHAAQDLKRLVDGNARDGNHAHGHVARPACGGTGPLAAPPAEAGSDTAFVTGLYKQLLGREPDADGMMAHMMGLAGGMSREEIQGVFLNSPEFKQKQAGGGAPGMGKGPGAVGSPGRYVNDALVLPDGRAIDWWTGNGGDFHDLDVPQPKTDRNTGITDINAPFSSSVTGHEYGRDGVIGRM